MNKILSEKDLVSIGLPVYNGLPYLKKAIESILAQTYPNIELIITDNPSTDGTQALCEEYAKRDHRIRYIRHKTNIGACENYNSALQAARGEYFNWVSFDDFLAPQYVEKCAAILKNDKEAVMAMSDYVHTNYKGEITHKLDPKRFIVTERGLYLRLKKFILMRWWDGKAMNIHGLWRREAIVNDVYRDLPDGDINFVFRGLSRGPFLLVPEVLFYKGVLPGGESREGEKLTVKRLILAIWTRIKLIQTHFINIKFVLGLRKLSTWQRVKLLWWEFYFAASMFTRRKF